MLIRGVTLASILNSCVLVLKSRVASFNICSPAFCLQPPYLSQRQESFICQLGHISTVSTKQSNVTICESYKD